MAVAKTYRSMVRNLVLVRESAIPGAPDGKGKRVHFSNGCYTTGDAWEQKFIESHPRFGSSITLVTVPEEQQAESN